MKEVSFKEAQFLKLTDAEDFFEFFELTYDPQVLAAKRLHILKRYGQLVAEIEHHAGELTWEECERQYKEALAQAYWELVCQTPQEAALFPLFQGNGEGFTSPCIDCTFACPSSKPAEG